MNNDPFIIVPPCVDYDLLHEVMAYGPLGSEIDMQPVEVDEQTAHEREEDYAGHDAALSCMSMKETAFSGSKPEPALERIKRPA